MKGRKVCLVCCRLREKGDTTHRHTHTHTHTLTTCIFRNIWKYEICKKLVTEVESVESLGIRKRGEHAHKIYFLNGVL